ncbi:MAG: thioredoxin-disulfide reductase [Spirochaetota bacterium]
MQSKYDIVIVGAGAAGLTAAQYGARANLRTLVLEKTANGGQCLQIEGLENYPGFPDPINGYDFTELFERQARQFGAELRVATVSRLDKQADEFVLETSEGEVRASAVILATGAKHRHLGVPGEEELAGRGVSYCATCDGPFFKNRRILVVGGGDAACDEATFLSKLSDRITLVHRRDRFRAQPAVAQRVLDNPNITVRFNTVVREIHGAKNAMGMEQVGAVTLEDVRSGELQKVEMDAVFVFVGSIPQTDLVPTLPKDEAGYIVTDQRMETAVPGLFAVGDVRSTPFRQLVVAAGEGAVAAHAAAQHIEALTGNVYQEVTA